LLEVPAQRIGRLQNFCWPFVNRYVNGLFLLFEAAFQELHASGGLSGTGVAGHELGTSWQETSLQ